jgi:hypothetical protein
MMRRILRSSADRVHVIGVERQHRSDALAPAVLDRPFEQEACALSPFVVDHGFERINPFPCLDGILV